MVAETLPRVMPDLLKHEGGWSDHPSDPGGATMNGITLAVFRSYTGRPNATKTELRNISPALVERIYRQNYWRVIRGDDLPAGPDYATFDGAVNSGPSRGAKWLQRAVGATQDGQVGPVTIAAAKERDAVQAVKDICRYRLGFVQGLRTFSVFGRGWARRIADVEATGVKIALDARGIDPRPRLEAERTRAEANASLNGQGATATAGTSTAAGGAAAIDPSVVDQSSSLPGIVLLILGAIVAGLFLYRWHIGRQRAAAYAAAKEHAE